MFRWLSVVIFASSSLVVLPTHASPEEEAATSSAPPLPPSPSPSPRPRRVWYGWQTLLADATALAVVTGGAAAAKDLGTANPFLVAGVAGYVLGGPVVHFANGRPGTAVLDLVVRTAGPALVGGLFAMAGQSNGDGFDFSAAFGVFGAVLAGCGAIAIDASVLARKPPAEPDASWNIVPRLQLGRNSAGLTVGGSL